MSRLWRKGCGLRSASDVEASVDAGADAVGLVFHPASPRHLTIAEAREVASAVPPGVARVAVFLRPDPSEVAAIVRAVSPDFVQADRASLAALGPDVAARTLPVLRDAEPVVDPLPPLLLYEGAHSGAGQRADWSRAAALAGRTRLVLAGGLDARCVGDAIRTVRPYGVDVSSGVEATRGVKDPGMIHEFVEAARSAERALDAEEIHR